MSGIQLSNIYKARKSNRDVFHELMPFKVKDILLVATYYDAYTIAREGQFSDKIYGEFLQLNLYVAPRFVSVSTQDEALEILKKRQFDIVILMAGINKDKPISLSKKIKKIVPKTPVLILANNNNDIAYFEEIKDEIKDYVERVFVWNGSTKIFMAMTKYIEDKKNLSTDVRLGDVRVILLVEDSIKYYSRYLPLLYTQLMTQTQNLIEHEDDGIDEMHKIIQLRARPKIILVSEYEEAKEVIDIYKDNLLCLITDVKFSNRQIHDFEAGIKLVKYSRSQGIDIPIVIQSHNIENAMRAMRLKVDFINKSSETLEVDMQNFLREKLGFGIFVFRNQLGTKIAEAKTLEEFEEKLRTIPDESLLHHAKHEDFSTWFMARGELYTSKRLRSRKAEEFKSVHAIREFCLQMFADSRLKQLKGRIVPYRSSLVNSRKYILRLGKGSLGGKGRSIAFISNFIENINLKKIFPGIRISIPKTCIIGVEEYDRFLEVNNLHSDVFLEKNYEKIKSTFIDASLSEKLINKLNKYLNVINFPLAVRSSGLFEDSFNKPFAGVYKTYLLPNNHQNYKIRLQQLQDAIKLVYASIFTQSSQNYFKAVGYKIGEEKMAVVIQELVGQEYNQKFYPNISGVAQSYNFYPFSYMKPEDGFSVIGLGLGRYVVGGEKAYRLCPKFPKLHQMTTQDQIKDSQQHFYALDLTQNDVDLAKEGDMASIGKYPLSIAEKDGTLTHCASVYDRQNDRFEPGLGIKGPRIINFANILQHEYIPLAKTLSRVLEIFRQAMGAPVEIEFAVDLAPDKEKTLPTLFLLQIRPLIKYSTDTELNLKEIPEDKILIYSTKGMGNGKLEHIQDIVYVDAKKFDRTRTEEMALEAEYFNRKMKKADREYILIGPGRWGTKDRFTGIPVVWTQISKAKIIVEMGLEDYPLDASLGSHFFHNVTSMNIGYFSVSSQSINSKLDYDLLEKQKEEEKLIYLKHVRFKKTLNVIMDGKKQEAVIVFDD